MDQLKRLVEAFQIHNWYAVVALGMTIVIQIVRSGTNVPLVKFLTAIWYRIPDGWRWIPQVTVGAFIGAFQGGASLSQAILAAIGGALGIGTTAMGLHAIVKESPLRIDGGPGGK